MKIERGVAQILCALRIDQKLHPLAFHHCVARFFRVERHLVLQTGTATFSDLNAQTLFRATLLVEQKTELPNRALRHLYHSQRTYDCAVYSQPNRPGPHGRSFLWKSNTNSRKLSESKIKHP